MPWLDGPDAPWGEAPSFAGKRALSALALGGGIGLAVGLLRLLVLT
jgi:hypothetical protein